QTALTWECGLQSVGFSLVHVSPLVVFLLFPYGLALWLAVCVAYVAWRLKKGRTVSRALLITAGLSVVLLGSLMLPYEAWMKLFTNRLADSPRAGDFFARAAASGDIAAVKTFLARGTPVDARDRYSGMTALHAAAANGQMAVVEYLIAAGADVNAIDRA